MGVIGMNDAGRIGFLIRGEYSDLETYDFLDIVYYNESSYVAKKTSTGNPPHRNNEFWQIFATGGGSATGGVTNYSELENLPKINNVTLNGNKSLEDLGVPTKTSGLVNDSGFKTTDTWKQNTANSEGYVEKGTGHANQVWKTDANGVPGWRPDANTTYGDVTASAHGLMTASDKTKLDGIAAGANKTTLTKSLAVTEEGVSALDGTVGKILDSKISTLNDNLAHGQIAFTVVNGEPYVKVGADPARPFNSPAYAIFQTERDVSYKAGAVLKLVQHNNFTVNGNTLTCKRAGTYTLRIAGNTKGGGHTATVKTIINGVENKICDLNYVPAIIETSITLKIGDTFCVSITTPTLAAGYAQHMIVLDRS